MKFLRGVELPESYDMIIDQSLAEEEAPIDFWKTFGDQLKSADPSLFFKVQRAWNDKMNLKELKAAVAGNPEISKLLEDYLQEKPTRWKIWAKIISDGDPRQTSLSLAAEASRAMKMLRHYFDGTSRPTVEAAIFAALVAGAKMTELKATLAHPAPTQVSKIHPLKPHVEKLYKAWRADPANEGSRRPSYTWVMYALKRAEVIQIEGKMIHSNGGADVWELDIETYENYVSAWIKEFKASTS